MSINQRSRVPALALTQVKRRMNMTMTSDYVQKLPQVVPDSDTARRVNNLHNRKHSIILGN